MMIRSHLLHEIRFRVTEVLFFINGFGGKGRNSMNNFSIYNMHKNPIVAIAAF